MSTKNLKKCKECGKFKNCTCEQKVTNQVSVIEKNENEQYFEFSNNLITEYFESFGEKLLQNNIEITLVNDDLLVLSSNNKTIEIYFDEESKIYQVRSILNKFKYSENSSKYYRNILKLKSLKAVISYSHCHLSIEK